MRLTLAALVSVVAMPVMAADAVLGMYKTQPGDEGNYAHVQFYECEDKICGVIRKAFDGAGKQLDSDTVGKRIVWGMSADGDGEYSGGKIWAPDRDKVYKSKMELDGNALTVEGCVAFICRGQVWTRIN